MNVYKDKYKYYIVVKSIPFLQIGDKLISNGYLKGGLTHSFSKEILVDGVKRVVGNYNIRHTEIEQEYIISEKEYLKRKLDLLINEN